MHWSERRWVRVLCGRHGQPLGIALLALLLMIELAPDWFGLGFVRLAAFDAYQRWAPRARHSGPAVVVAIDDESLRLHGQWPWPRTWLAQLVSRIAESNPAAIGVDIVMPEADRLSPGRLPEFVPGMGPDLVQRLTTLPSNDSVLARTLQSSRVVLGIAGLEAEAPGPRHSVRRAPFRTVGGDPRPLVRRFDATLHSADEIDRVVKGHGLLSVDPERGVVRRMPLVATVGEALVPAFGIEILRVAAGGPIVTVRTGASGVQDVEVFYQNRPAGFTDSSGRILIPGLLSYQTNKIAIDTTKLPVDADVTASETVVAPADRSGVKVDFTVKTDDHPAVVVFQGADGKPWSPAPPDRSKAARASRSAMTAVPTSRTCPPPTTRPSRCSRESVTPRSLTSPIRASRW